MFSSDRHQAEKLREKALLAVEDFAKARLPQDMASPLRRLVGAAAQTTRLCTMQQLLDAQRIASISVLYHPPAAPHLIQRFACQMDEYSLLVPLDKGHNIGTSLIPARTIPHLENLYAGPIPSSDALLVKPFALRFIGHWFENIEGPMERVAYQATRPAERFTHEKLEQLTIEGNA